MKYRLTLLAVLILPLNLAHALSTFHLSDGWVIQSSAVESAPGILISDSVYSPKDWYPTKVPATVLAALTSNTVYPNPYYGLNLKDIPGYQEGRWLRMPDDSPFHDSWWYRKTFSVPVDYTGKSVRLHFEGINYAADIWLNGKLLASRADVRGMFRRFDFDVTRYLHLDEENVLAVNIFPPGLLPKREYKTKQIQATTGWDDHNPQPPDMNMGIWGKVYLSATEGVRLRHAHVATDLDIPSLESARLTVSVLVENETRVNQIVRVTGRINRGTSFIQKIQLRPLESKRIEFGPVRNKPLTIENPRVWWPAPIGEQPLYDLRLTASVDGSESHSVETRFGIREATTYIDRQGWRGYKINGKDILIRGGAWMTSDMLLQFSKRRYEALIRYARDAGFNMLRSEGFSIRETDEFYDLCDEYGIMVTQQLFGRSIPDEALAVACVEDTLLRIRNHPSLVHFLGHDETFPTESLDGAYRRLIESLTPSRSYQPHSGAFKAEDRFKTGGTRTGSREVWTYAEPSHYYTHPKTGAIGFAQSGGIGGVVAPLASIRQMMPADQVWPLSSESWSFHSVIQGGQYFAALHQALEDRYGAPDTLEAFVRKAHALNYDSARGMFEAYGRNKFEAKGITTWKYNAAWPAAITWQYIDWYLRPTGAYYGAKKACEPLHIQYAYDDRSIWVVNGYYDDFEDLEADVRVYDIDMNEHFASTSEIAVSASGKTKVLTLEDDPSLSTSYFLSLKLSNSLHQTVSNNFYWLSSVPDIPGDTTYEGGVFQIRPASRADLTALENLPPAQLKVSALFRQEGVETVGVITLTNPTAHLSFLNQLTIEIGDDHKDVAPVYWEDNMVTLLPNETRRLICRMDTTSLDGKTPVFVLRPWNGS